MRQTQNTEQHRARILKERKNYQYAWQGYLHLFTEYMLGIIVISYCLVKIENFNWLLFVNIPPTLIFGSFCVYMIHRYPFHRPVKYPKVFFHEHTERHHFYYSYDDYIITSAKEFKIILFDIVAMIFFVGGISIPISLLYAHFVSADFGYFFMIMSMFYFLLYEFFHTVAHLPETHFLAKLPYLKYMRQHHRLHHDWRNMHKKNFNVVIPIFDWVFGTSIR